MEWQASSEELTPAELTALLLRLEGIESQKELSDSYATVAAVCEATGESPHRVAALLEDIRSEDMKARVLARLRELEEPTFRVERPGHESQSSATQTYLAREQTLSTVLEKHVKPARREPALPAKESASASLASMAAYFALATVMFLIVGSLAIGFIWFMRQ